MIEIANQEYFDEVMAFAEEMGLKEQLEGKIEWLRSYGGSPAKHKAVLMPDIGGGKSFLFEVYGRDDADAFTKFRFNGGLIYFGPTDTGVGGPQFSVRLETGKAGWEIHT